MNKKQLTETDIITKYILPAVTEKGWDSMTQIRQEVKLRDGKVIVRGQVAARKKVKSADIVLYHKPNLPLAVIEAKANKHEIGKGMQQALDYAGLLATPFVFASNGDGFIFHDKTVQNGPIETEIALDEFPTPEELWLKFCQWEGYKESQLPVLTQPYHDDGTGKSPRYYQLQVINKTIEAISSGQNRILLVMATGTGKTYTAFQIIWRLWKSKSKKCILFLADRNVLVDQTRINDFQPFDTAMTKVEKRTVDPAYEIHLALYQALTGQEESQKTYKQVDRDFFDLIVIDECHRGSAAEDSAWREILEYFSSATQIGMTATPKETEEVSNIDYFGDPVYTYSLKEGIEDGFLAPYKVVRVDLDIDALGWRPTKGQTDKHGEVIPDRIYNAKDFDRTLVVDEWTDTGGEITGGPEMPFIKYHVSGVTVKKLAERVQYYDADGKLVTESFKDYTKKTIQKQFTSLDDFIKTWQDADRKQIIIDELENQGVIWQALEDDVSRDMDPFDLICHVAFDQPPLTRKERAENVKKRNYFTQYSETAQQVLNALLDKYADQGVGEIESIQVLKVTPFDQMGQPKEIVKKAFGNKQVYEQTISELEALLYASN